MVSTECAAFVYSLIIARMEGEFGVQKEGINARKTQVGEGAAGLLGHCLGTDPDDRGHSMPEHFQIFPCKRV